MMSVNAKRGRHDLGAERFRWLLESRHFKYWREEQIESVTHAVAATRRDFLAVRDGVSAIGACYPKRQFVHVEPRITPRPMRLTVFHNPFAKLPLDRVIFSDEEDRHIWQDSERGYIPART